MGSLEKSQKTLKVTELTQKEIRPKIKT